MIAVSLRKRASLWLNKYAMPVYKRRYRNGKIVWRYKFDAPGSTRENRIVIEKSGFTTRKEAQKAEAERRLELERQLAASGQVSAPAPTSLAALLQEFMERHAKKNLAPKTVQRYEELLGYLDQGLLRMPLNEITPLHLHREWQRLLESGGRSRHDKRARPLSPKTVRNIAGLVSAAFGRAVKWGLVTSNPVTHSEPPKCRRQPVVALTPSQIQALIDAASGPWCIKTFLTVAAATGCRRGELLALRWSDIVDGRALISRSLTQTKEGLRFKPTKTGKPRAVALPASAIAALEEHRRQQDEFRRQFGPDYRSDLDLVFANPDGTPLRPDSLSAAVSALFRRLKIEKPKGAALHMLRHSHTSVLLAAGAPLPAVSARLGHSSMRTTQEVYAHMIRGQDEQAAKLWDQFVRRHGITADDDHGGIVQ